MLLQATPFDHVYGEARKIVNLRLTRPWSASLQKIVILKVDNYNLEVDDLDGKVFLKIINPKNWRRNCEKNNF